MPDSVQCAECGTRYDSEKNPFCPHCGSTGGKVPAAAGAAVVASAIDPVAKRVRRAGIILMVMGSFFLVQLILAIVLPGGYLDSGGAEALADRPGGTLVVLTEPAVEGNVTLRTLEGQEFAAAPLANGTARLDLEGHAAANATLHAPQGNWSRTVVAITGQEVRWTVDTTQEPEVEDATLVAGGLKRMAQAAGTFAAALSALILAGGYAAFRRRWRGLALAGAIVGALLGLFAVMGFFLLGLLFAVPLGYALVAILRGKPAFT